MQRIENDVSSKAADKLTAEAAAAKDGDDLKKSAESLAKEMKLGTTNKNVIDSIVKMRTSLIDEVSRMLIRFCYQNEEFANEVCRCERTLSDAVDALMKNISPDKPQFSDVEAYAAAVQFYIPSAQVTVSFRLTIPTEIDDDLLEINDEGEESHAIILDLFDMEG